MTDQELERLIAEGHEWNSKQPAPTFGHQGRDDIPSEITADGPYFYFYVRPCRTPAPGEAWDGTRLRQVFAGAAIRSYSASDGTPIREVIGTCDKSKLGWMKSTNLPWTTLQVGDKYRVPQSTHPWIGNPNIPHTTALVNLINTGVVNTNHTGRLTELRSKIRTVTERLELDKHPSTRAMLQSILERHRQDEVELLRIINLDKLIHDDGCDKW